MDGLRKEKRKTEEKTGVVESIMGVFKPKDEAAPVKTMTVRQEVKKLRRVTRTGKMARKHGSEAFHAPAMTQKEVRITEEVMGSVTPSAPAVHSEADGGFTCVQCGERMPASVDRCPKCHMLYIKNVTNEELEEAAAAEEALDEDAEGFVASDAAPCIHFDAETGTISYLENDDSDPDFVLECSHCGTEVQFNTDHCPICGTKLDVPDTGIVSLFTDMRFEDDHSEGELDCPLCGEHVALVDGVCPACKEKVEGPDAKEKVEPVIRGDNVVFMHLDVETGELNYLQRLAKRLGFEQMTVHLDGIGRGGGFDQDWKSLSRI